MALNKQGVLLRVKAAGDVLGQLGHRAAAQLRGILADGDAVQIRHEIKAVKLLCEAGPVLHSAQVVAQVQVAGGLNAGEHDFFRVDGSGIFHNFCSSISQKDISARLHILPK